MKKTIIVLVCLLVLATALFADTVVTSSVGLSFQNMKGTLKEQGATTSLTKARHLSVSMDSSFFGDGSGLGLNVGLALLFPLSGSTDGVELETDFLYVGWCPRIGLSNLFEINEEISMLSSVGYQMMMKFDSATIEGVAIKTSLFIHGLYGQDAIIFNLSSNATFNAGINVYFPLSGSIKLSATGYGSESAKISYSGAFITPFVGFNIKR